MGWAPFLIITGLCLQFTHPGLFCHWLIGDYDFQILLDKVPFIYKLLSIGDFLAQTTIGIFQFFHKGSFLIWQETKCYSDPNSVPSPSSTPSTNLLVGVALWPHHTAISCRGAVE